MAYALQNEELMSELQTIEVIRVITEVFSFNKILGFCFLHLNLATRSPFFLDDVIPEGQLH